MKTLCRFYVQFYQNYMNSLIYFVLWFNLDCLFMIIILNECRSIAEKCALNRATNLLPRVLFVVELEGYSEKDHFVDVYSDMPLLCQSLQIVRTARCFNLQSHRPDADREFIFSRNMHIVGSVNNQERGIGKTQPGWSARQVKQGAFTCLKVFFNGGLVKEGDGLAKAGCCGQGQVFDIRLAIPMMG